MSADIIKQLETMAHEWRELYRLREEAAAEMEELSDSIKAIMGDSEQVIAGEYKLTYKSVISSRIDTTALKQALPEVAARYTKQTTTKRFTIQ